MCVLWLLFWYLSGTVQRQRVNAVISLNGVHGVQLHIKEKEDETIKSWTQTITQTSDPCDHPLDHT